MNKLVALLIWITVFSLWSTIVFADHGFGGIEVVRKNLGDINNDGKRESVVEETSWGASSCSIQIKLFAGNKIIFKFPLFSGDTADGYKVVGKKIVVWRGNWVSVQSKWEPHYYNFMWYGWNTKTKKYLVVQEGITTTAYSYEKALRSMPFLAQNPNKLNLSKTIVAAVQFYCLNNQFPGWPSPPLRACYQSKQIKNDWASISTNIVDKKEQTVGKDCYFLVHRFNGRWKVAWFSDEKKMHPRIARQIGATDNVIKELGWSLYDSGPQDDM